jgi:hypothetical protein
MNMANHTLLATRHDEREGAPAGLEKSGCEKSGREESIAMMDYPRWCARDAHARRKEHGKIADRVRS